MAPCDAMAEIRRLEAELERHKRAVEWCLEKRPLIGDDGQTYFDHDELGWRNIAVPAEFADIIKPTAGGDGNG